MSNPMLTVGFLNWNKALVRIVAIVAIPVGIIVVGFLLTAIMRRGKKR